MTIPPEPVPSIDNSEHSNTSSVPPSADGPTRWPTPTWPLCWLRRPRWKPATAVSIAVVAGLAAATIAAIMVTRTTLTGGSPAHVPASARTPPLHAAPDLSPPLQGPGTGSGVPSPPSAGPDSPPSDPARNQRTTVQRRVPVRTVRPRFPDAFHGEIRVQEEVVAGPNPHAETSGHPGLGSASHDSPAP